MNIQELVDLFDGDVYGSMFLVYSGTDSVSEVIAFHVAVQEQAIVLYTNGDELPPNAWDISSSADFIERAERRNEISRFDLHTWSLMALDKQDKFGFVEFQDIEDNGDCMLFVNDSDSLFLSEQYDLEKRDPSYRSSTKVSDIMEYIGIDFDKPIAVLSSASKCQTDVVFFSVSWEERFVILHTNSYFPPDSAYEVASIGDFIEQINEIEDETNIELGRWQLLAADYNEQLCGLKTWGIDRDGTFILMTVENDIIW